MSGDPKIIEVLNAQRRDAVERLGTGIARFRTVGDTDGAVRSDRLLVSEESHLDSRELQLHRVEAMGLPGYLTTATRE